MKEEKGNYVIVSACFSGMSVYSPELNPCGPVWYGAGIAYYYSSASVIYDPANGIFYGYAYSDTVKCALNAAPGVPFFTEGQTVTAIRVPANLRPRMTPAREYKAAPRRAQGNDRIFFEDGGSRCS